VRFFAASELVTLQIHPPIRTRIQG